MEMQSSQRRAVANHRRRLAERGITRFEVKGLDTDKKLIRTLATRLATDGVESARLRAEIVKTIGEDPSGKGGILAALRRSPLVGAELDVNRNRSEGRPIDL